MAVLVCLWCIPLHLWLPTQRCAGVLLALLVPSQSWFGRSFVLVCA